MGYWQAGATIAGDLLGMSGASSANAATRQFEQQQQLQAESWEEKMSDTAIQRRMADASAAGVNPMLAVTTGGASQPGIAPQSSPMQNTMSSFGNLGQQVGGALQTESAIKLQEAQAQQAIELANKAHAETPTPAYQKGQPGDIDYEVGDDYHKLGDANVANIQANTNLSTAQAQQVGAYIKLMGAQLDNTDANTANTNIQRLINSLSLETAKAVQQSVIQQALTEGIKAKNVQDLQSTRWGPTLTFLNSVLQPAHTASQIAGQLAR